MFPIPFYYIWTPKYKVFHTILSDCLSNYKDIFDPRPIYISQEEFDASIQKGPGRFTSWFMKIDTILELLHSLPEKSYFIFADADLYLFPNKNIKKLIELYIESEIDFVAMRESNNLRIANFGFTLFRVCEENKKLLAKTHTIDKEQLELSDQALLNVSLKTFTGTHAFFPPVFITTSSTCIEINEIPDSLQSMRSKIMIHQPIPSGDTPGDLKIIKKLFEFHQLGVDLTKYANCMPVVKINGLEYKLAP